MEYVVAGKEYEETLDNTGRCHENKGSVDRAGALWRLSGLPV